MKFKVGEKVKVLCGDLIFNGEVFGIADSGGIYNERYAVSYIDAGGDLVTDVISGEKLEKRSEYKFKQDDVLECVAAIKKNKYIILKHLENSCSVKKSYKMLVLCNGQYGVVNYDKEVVEKDFIKTGEI